MKRAILAWAFLLFWLTALWVNSNRTKFQEAYSRAKENWITTMNTIEWARMNDWLTREEMAKMISNYATNILWKTPDTTKFCYFLDSNINPDLVKYVTESCQLWLMWQWVTSFRPKDFVTRAEFWTVLSRLLYWSTYEWWEKYYTNHLLALQNNWIMNIISNPFMNEVRWYVMIMMQRSSLKYEKQNSVDTWKNERTEDVNDEKTKYADYLIATKVVNVIDWDTISVKLDWKTVSVRLIWVDTPEKTTKRYGYAECYWEEASEYLSRILDWKDIYLEYDESQWQYDSYDRILAYVFLSSENINKKIISDWYGWEYTYDKPYKYQSDFKEAQNLAKKKNLWLWNTCNGERVPLEKEDTENTVTHNWNIKWNISNKWVKIYHVPWCSHYEKTVITESKWERWFSTTQEAEEAWWRACID
jgi:micrococcal nuclease